MDERRKNPGYEALVRYWTSLGIPEAEARAAARKVHPDPKPVVVCPNCRFRHR